MKIISNKRYKYYRCLEDKSNSKRNDNHIAKDNHDVSLEEVLNFVEDMVLCNKIVLDDIPVEIRSSARSIYIYAMRVERVINGKTGIYGILRILESDIQYAKENDMITQLAYLSHQKLYISEVLEGL